MQAQTWLPSSGAAPVASPATASDAVVGASPASDASRAQTPAPVKAADAEVAALNRRGGDEPPASPAGAPRLASPLGFRAPPPGFSPAAAAAPLELGATSFDEDSETEAVFRRARDALLLQRARSTLPPAPAADDENLSEWDTDDGGVTWVKAAAAQRRVAAQAGRRTGRATPALRGVGSPHRPLSPVLEPASSLRHALRSVLLPLACYFVVVGVWHSVKPMLPQHVLDRML
jgi:hypothetical protein